MLVSPGRARSHHALRPRRNRRRSCIQRGGVLVAALMMVVTAAVGCTDSDPARDAGGYLVRVGEQVLTIPAFDRALEVAKTAYSQMDLEQQGVYAALQKRLLEQLIEEMVVIDQAQQKGIEVTDAELAAEVARIRSDYPEGQFEDQLLAAAISPAAWEERLHARMIMQKVIDQELGPTITITADDVAVYYRRHFPHGAPADQFDGLDRKIVSLLRKEKLQAAYSRWIKATMAQYTIHINEPLWQRLCQRAP